MKKKPAKAKARKKSRKPKVGFGKKTPEQHLAEIRSHSLRATIAKCGTAG